ncbi:hypothetical protein AVEN_230651-1 [Araneus ventricosus]|uniref:Uncharacterized protein n=1 Tax=Araneus ventricosus TaxID=182803 RepID=A0A4Y2A277_ARAVE|nr:hypothetical protein AVEN_230651-1 [Araneus ventricosus]
MGTSLMFLDFCQTLGKDFLPEMRSPGLTSVPLKDLDGVDSFLASYSWEERRKATVQQLSITPNRSRMPQFSLDAGSVSHFLGGK